MQRSYLSIPSTDLDKKSDEELFGELACKLPFAVEPTQRSAWQFQIRHLRVISRDLPDAHFFVEFLVPRMGRRADLVVVQAGIIFVIEYKLGATSFDRSSIDQVYGYGLDLKHFHETSHGKPIVPILIATKAEPEHDQGIRWDDDSLAHPIKVIPDELAGAINHLCRIWGGEDIDALRWAAGRYKPTPTIVEAAQALYSGHDVTEISRSEAGAENLTTTAEYVSHAIERARNEHRKIICFVTGVPGSGKTLAGLNLATTRQRTHSDEHAVFLSGNGPLVEVLREALALDAVSRAKQRGERTSKTIEHRRASAFIQNIHHFRDEALTSPNPPIEKVAIFDEAQRAWNADQTSKFMQQKRGQTDFSMSEPEFLLSVMDRHDDWCAIVCLIGGGQEINTGEAGVSEWLNALRRHFDRWEVHLPPAIQNDLEELSTVSAPELHLSTSVRSFRAEKLSEFVGRLIEGNLEEARSIAEKIERYPLLLTRELEEAREWLRKQRRGSERTGLLAHSNGARLKPEGIFVKSKIDPGKWFLSDQIDVRSSDALEDAATEFDVQGLELDWACVCWDANLRWHSGWSFHRFRGSRWESINDQSAQTYLANAYRVLLTRSRQGLVVFVPKGTENDPTRPPSEYDKIADALTKAGFASLNHFALN